MVKRSLQIQEQYQAQAKNAAISLGLTQKAIAIRVSCSRQPVSRFFNCKPVSYELFVEICTILKLDWQEITGTKSTDPKSTVDNAQQTEVDQSIDIDINNLVTLFCHSRQKSSKIHPNNRPNILSNPTHLF